MSSIAQRPTQINIPKFSKESGRKSEDLTKESEEEEVIKSAEDYFNKHRELIDSTKPVSSLIIELCIYVDRF